VDGCLQVRNNTQTGAGHPKDKGDEDIWVNDDEDNDSNLGVNNAEEYLQNCIVEDQVANIRHAAIKVACHVNPFQEQTNEDQFYMVLEEVRRNVLIPEGYWVLECEWENLLYPETEAINLRTCGNEIVVVLPKAI
jgi:hypothetical protein